MLRFSPPVMAFVAVFALVTLHPAVPVHAAGLYGDEGKDVKTGDICSQDYWWTKFDMMMLDYALKQHQPEGRIGLELASTQKRLDDLGKAFPNHEGIKAWKKQVDEVVSKIDPNANRSESFKPGCPWEEANFAQLWVNLHWSKMLAEKKDYEQAKGLMQNVVYNYGLLDKPDRLKDYPEDLKKWFEDNKPVAQQFYKELKEKTAH